MMILEKLGKDRNDIQNCRGQAYDDAALMAGLQTGVQKRIKEINKNQNLSLVQITRWIWRGFMQLLLMWIPWPFLMCGTFVWIFSSSTHHWEVLTSVTGQSVKRITETRWSARGAGASVVKKHFSKIWSALEKLAGEEENAATREHGRRKDFFHGGAPGDFSKISPGGAKSGEICFPHSKLRKQPFLVKFSKSRGARASWPPSDAHAREYAGVLLVAIIFLFMLSWPVATRPSRN